MSLSDLGNLGEFIGAIAVVVSLVYLAFQIRQNTRQVRASTFQGAARGWQDFCYAVASADHPLIWYKGTRDLETLSDEESVKFSLLVRAYFRGYENDYYQYRSGTFDTVAWEGYVKALRNDGLSRPGIRAAWNEVRGLFDEEFAAFIDRELRGTPVETPGTLASAVRGSSGDQSSSA